MSKKYASSTVSNAAIRNIISEISVALFDDVTEERLKQELSDYTVQGVNDVREDCKDLYVDDYIFTIHPLTNEECVGVSGVRCGNILLSIYVEVWVTDTYGYEMQLINGISIPSQTFEENKLKSIDKNIKSINETFSKNRSK